MSAKAQSRNLPEQSSGSPRTKSLILAAGVGSRLRPLTDNVPKCLVDVGGRPLLEYWLQGLATIGAQAALLNTHAHADKVRAYIGRHNALGGGVLLDETHEPELLGSAGTITANESFADDADEILLIDADNFSTVDLEQMLAFHRNHEAPCTMLLFHASNPSACGIAELDPSGRITAFTEKPAEPVSDLANAGVYVMDAALFREIANLEAFDLGFDVLPKLVGRMAGFVHKGFHVDIGTPAAYAHACIEARRLLAPLGQAADGTRAAVFLDRDGTLIESVHYLSDPDQVVLVPKCAAAMLRLRRAGFALIVVTNQAAVGKGLIDEQRLERIHQRMHALMAAAGFGVDAVYHCPQPGAGSDRAIIEHPDRKPGPGMLRRGATESRLDLTRSYMVGDMQSDVLAGFNAGCRANVLINRAPANAADLLHFDYPRVASLSDAADWILNDAGLGEP